MMISHFAVVLCGAFHPSNLKRLTVKNIYAGKVRGKQHRVPLTRKSEGHMPPLLPWFRGGCATI